MNSTLTLTTWGRRLNKQLLKPQLAPKPGSNVDKSQLHHRWKIIRGDTVQVIQGPSTGQRGKVLAVLRESNRVIIDGVNMRNRTVKARMSGEPGRTVSRPGSIHYSNVMLIDPVTNEPTKVSRRFLEDGTKVRVSNKTGHIIPTPQFDRKPRSLVMGPKDTDPRDVFSVSFPDYEKYLPFIYKSESDKVDDASRK